MTWEGFVFYFNFQFAFLRHDIDILFCCQRLFKQKNKQKFQKKDTNQIVVDIRLQFCKMIYLISVFKNCNKQPVYHHFVQTLFFNT